MADGQNNGNGPNTTLQLVIVWDQVTGAVQVSGPIQNKVIALGMLEAAKDAIVKFNDKAIADSRIVVPAPNLRM